MQCLRLCLVGSNRQTQCPLGFGEKLLLRACSVSTPSKGRRWSGTPLSQESEATSSNTRKDDIGTLSIHLLSSAECSNFTWKFALSDVTMASPQAAPAGRSTYQEVMYRFCSLIPSDGRKGHQTSILLTVIFA